MKNKKTYGKIDVVDPHNNLTLIQCDVFLLPKWYQIDVKIHFYLLNPLSRIPKKVLKYRNNALSCHVTLKQFCNSRRHFVWKRIRNIFKFSLFVKGLLTGLGQNWDALESLWMLSKEKNEILHIYLIIKLAKLIFTFKFHTICQTINKAGLIDDIISLHG